jgi:hypothetical protein
MMEAESTSETSVNFFQTYHPDDGAASTSETSVNFYQTTRRNNVEESHLKIGFLISDIENIETRRKRDQ